jgi:hypothetical protein
MIECADALWSNPPSTFARSRQVDSEATQKALSRCGRCVSYKSSTTFRCTGGILHSLDEFAVSNQPKPVPNGLRRPRPAVQQAMGPVSIVKRY